MLVKKAIRKMFITTMSLFIIMTIYLFPLASTEKKTLKTNLELEYVTGLGNHSIYLLNQDGLLVKTKILLDSKELEENIKTMVLNMTTSSSTKFPELLDTPIPKNTRLLQVEIKDDLALLNFSKELMQVEEAKEEKMIEAIVYSITELDGIDGVVMQVEGEDLVEYPASKKALPSVLTRKIGINKRYQFTSLKDINKVVIYYTGNINDTPYYVPVTKYTNDARDKIEIIIEELTTGYIYEPNLMSLIREDVKLLASSREDDLLILNFNDALFDASGTIKEEVLYTIGYSVFENYDVNTTSIRVNDKEAVNIKRSSLP